MWVMPLADELVLLAYDDRGVARAPSGTLDHGLAGAVLLDLVLAGRVGMAGKRVAVLDPTPTGDPLLDAALRSIGAERTMRKPDVWVDRLRRGLRPAVLDRLVAAGMLRRETGTVLWVFPRTRYPRAGGTEPPATTDARGRMHNLIAAGGPADPRTVGLCALVGAMGWGRRLFPDLPRGQVSARLKEIRRQCWPAEAVKRAIDAAQAVAAGVVTPGAG